MDLLLTIPIELRVAACFFIGAVVGSFVNLAVYRFAWNQRSISPYSAAPAGSVRRTWSDRMPVLGWLRMRRESPIHGTGFWLRPMFVELCLGAGFAALYWWEIDQQALLPDPDTGPALPIGPRYALTTNLLLHGSLLSHWILIVLMAVATLIDIDEKTIPDQITLPGTILGLLLAALLPWSLLPGKTFVLTAGWPPFDRFVEYLQIASPNLWPATLNAGVPHFRSLLLALACLWLWSFAVLPRTWHGRYGVLRAIRFFVAKIVREPFSWMVLGVSTAATVGIAIVWLVGGDAFFALLTALVGMATGTIIIWSIRLVGRAVLRKEAMGFGDVTLMAMIGAFLGWQSCLVVFFLAPIAGLVVGVLQWLLIRDNVIPYGPFLCLAALVSLVWWAPIWNYLQPAFFLMGTWIPIILMLCLAVMAILLALLQAIKAMLRRFF